MIIFQLALTLRFTLPHQRKVPVDGGSLITFACPSQQSKGPQSSAGSQRPQS